MEAQGRISENRIVKRKIKNAAKASTKAAFKKQILLVILLLLLISGTRMIMSIKITRSDKIIADGIKQCEELKKTKLNLAAKIEALKKSSKIKEDAQYKLGMVYPEPDQIKYIELDDEVVNAKQNAGVIQQIKAVFMLFSGSI